MLDFLTLSIINKRTCVLTYHFITSKIKHLTMKHSFNILTLLAVCASAFTFMSCQETEEVNEYDNWEVRNQMYIDSIAKVCALNEDGKWVRYCAFNYDELIENAKGNNNHFIYVHKNVDGNGSYSPQFNDSVRVHYLGHLIPSDSYKSGYIFYKTYNGYTLNEKTDVPLLLGSKETVVGFSTAVMHMVEGDDCTVYIPYDIGGGVDDGIINGKGNQVPGYSTLVFSLKLAKVYRYGLGEDYTWY